VKNGVPFDVAFQLDDITRSAWSIILSELESGKRFNFNTEAFEEVT